MMETWCRQLLQMIVAVVFFYAFEYALAIRFHGWHNVNASSLLISKEYLLAMTCALIEYVAELILIPELKEQWWLSKLGLSLVVIGELIRKSAVITAGNAFTHSIRTYYEEDHDLVTGGIYRFVRHAGYCGFFIWATGTQFMLCNPICIVGFTFVTWCFFSRRIRHEEFFLRQFFGQQYETYAQKVPSGFRLSNKHRYMTSWARKCYRRTMMSDGTSPSKRAIDFDTSLKDNLLNGRYEDGNDYLNKAPYAKMAHPWPDHFYPLHVAMGAAGEEAKAELMNRSWTGLD